MKIIFLLSLFLIISLLAKGMGYPQDMFAEHITVKTVEKTVVKSQSKEACPTKKPSKSAPSRSLKQPNQSYRLPERFDFYQPSIISMKTFDLEENAIEEQTIPISTVTNEKWVCLAMGRSLIESHRQLMAYLLRKISFKHFNASAMQGCSLVLG